MKIKPFNHESSLYPFRWFIVFTLCVAAFMLYADLSGWRMFASSGQQQWNASGPGFHK